MEKTGSNHFKSIPPSTKDRSILAVFGFILFVIVGMFFSLNCEEIIMPGQFIFMSVLSLIIICHILQIIYRTKTIISGEVFTLSLFLIVYPLSALVHFYGSGFSRGHFDIVRTGSEHYLVNLSIFLICIAYFFLILGMKMVKDKEPQKSNLVSKYNGTVLLFSGLFFMLIGAIGVVKIYQYTGLSFSSFLFNVNKELRSNVPSGYARYLFMRGYFPWGCLFVLSFLLGRDMFSKHFVLKYATIAVMMFLIVFSLWFSGGRLAIIMAIVTVLFFLNKQKLIKFNVVKLTIPLVIIMFIILLLSQQRSEAYHVNPINNFINIFDWHIGRFSMIGCSIQLRGECAVDNISIFKPFCNLFDFLISLLSFEPVFSEYRSTPSYFGEFLVGNPDICGILPGGIGDMYLNLSIFGVAIWAFIFGWVIKKISILIRHTSSLAFFFLLTNILLYMLRDFAGVANGWVFSGVINSVPIIFLLLWSSIQKKQYTPSG